MEYSDIKQEAKEGLYNDLSWIDDHLENCDGCNKRGSLKSKYVYEGNPNVPISLWGAEWDENIYCSDCIPQRWNRILEQS